MGTNFYVKGHLGNDDPRYHIGKRSAAGLYCYDCGVSLCVTGYRNVHMGDSFYETCPSCGKSYSKEGLSDSSVGRELGFNKNKPVKKHGVSTCASFTWARNLGRIRYIVDEYGTQYTRAEFEEMLLECPIQFYKFREWFS